MILIFFEVPTCGYIDVSHQWNYTKFFFLFFNFCLNIFYFNRISPKVTTGIIQRLVNCTKSNCSL